MIKQLSGSEGLRETVEINSYCLFLPLCNEYAFKLSYWHQCNPKLELSES